MHGFLIDPWNRELAEVQAERWDGEQIRTRLVRPVPPKTTWVGSMTLYTGDRLWIDDMGCFVPGLPVFRIARYPHNLFGTGLVLGLGPEGDSRSPVITLQELQRDVIWTDLQTTGRQAPSQSFPGGVTLGPAIVRPVGSGGAA